VFGDGEAKINLVGIEGLPELVWADRMTRGEIRRSMRVVADQQASLLQKREKIRDRTD
jgi:hypothetical protein